MDYHAFERRALATGVLVRTQLTLKTGVLVVADTLVGQPLAQACVTTPIADAVAAAGGTGPITWRVERMSDGTKRVHASAAVARVRAMEGWDAYAAA